METIILVPGGGGSRLKLNREEVWPPTLREMEFGYHRMKKLLDKHVEVGNIFDGIPCYGVYNPLQSDLKEIAQHLKCKSVDFPYDWRKDIFEQADKLATKIASYVSSGSTSITLVGHSMGNLLARLILESNTYRNKSWFKKITRFVGICGPHYGVPHVLTFALGLNGSLGISRADMKKATGDTNYPGCYQCLPFVGHKVLVDINDGPQDFYDPVVATKFGLSVDNLDRAKELQCELNFDKKPPEVRYALIAGSDQTTDEAIYFDDTIFHAIDTDYNGDSMIPLWSSTDRRFRRHVTPGDHMGMLKSYPFKQILYDVFTAGALTPKLTRIDQPGVTLSLNDFVFAPHEPITVVIIPDLSTQEISGTLQISRATDPTAEKFAPYHTQAVEYRGPQITRIRATIYAPADPGAYQLALAGSHGTSPGTAAGFVVSRPPA